MKTGAITFGHRVWDYDWDPIPPPLSTSRVGAIATLVVTKDAMLVFKARCAANLLGDPIASQTRASGFQCMNWVAATAIPLPQLTVRPEAQSRSGLWS